MKDGGPAFPFHVDAVAGFYNAVDYPGMSLRDFFAAAALQGMLANGVAVDNRAEIAYDYADAMLEAREKWRP